MRATMQDSGLGDRGERSCRGRGKALRVTERTGPFTPLFARTIQDRIRAFGLQDDLEDEILELFGLGPRIIERQDALLCLEFFRASDTERRQVVQLRLRAEGLTIKFHDRRAETAQIVRKAVRHDRRRGDDKVVLAVQGPESRLTLAVLKTIGLYLRSR